VLSKAQSQVKSSSHSLYTALKRLFHTLVVSTVFALVVVLILLLQQYQNDWLTVQTRFSGESIARQYAKLLQPAFIADQLTSEGLEIDAGTALLNNIARRDYIESVAAILINEPHILALSVFDKDGRYIAPLPQIESVVSMSQSQSVTPLTYVGVITDDNENLLGYVNIHMNTQAVLESPLTLRYQLALIACILVFLALMLGIYLTRAFYKSRPWFIQVIESKRNKEKR
jgi:membrane protein